MTDVADPSIVTNPAKSDADHVNPAETRDDIGDASRRHDASRADDASRHYYDDDITRKCLWATVAWLVVSLAFGLFAGLLMIVPIPMAETSLDRSWWTFARLRPVHTNIAVFGVLANAVFMFVHFSVPRLCRTPMASPAISRVHFWVWQLTIAAAALTPMFGFTQSKEYAEWEWPFDIAVTVLWWMLALNFFITVYRRTVRQSYISIWFYAASMVVVGVVYPLNSIAKPGMGDGVNYWLHSTPYLGGAGDAVLQWVYGHNLITFLMSIPFVGALYYFLPKACGRPIHSYPLAVLHFWSLIILAVWAGPHHLHLTAAPDWVTSLGMVFSLMIWMPSWAGVINGWKTLPRRNGDADQPENRSGDQALQIASSDQTALAFFRVAIVAYAITITLGTLQSVKTINAWTHLTDFVVAYGHTATIGWCGMMIFGVAYFLTPRLFQTPMASNRLTRWHFWAAVIGLVLYVAPHYAAGIAQTRVWFSLNETGNLAFPDYATTLKHSRPFWIAGHVGSVLYVVGLGLFLINVAKTWAMRPARYERSLIEPGSRIAAVVADHHPDADADDSVTAVGGASLTFEHSLVDAPVLEIAKRAERLRGWSWHESVESTPRSMAVFAAVMLGLVAIVEVAPVALANARAASDAPELAYTPLQQIGREIYRREGCVNCHTQVVRPLVAEFKRYGRPNVASDYVHDRPFLWGSRRIGPDLGREAGRREGIWHYEHLVDPRSKEADSIMPTFDHLARRRYADVSRRHADGVRGDADDSQRESAENSTDPEAASDEVGSPDEVDDRIERSRREALDVAATVVSNGGPLSVNGVMTYDSELVALIAYLQRLGAEPPPASNDSLNNSPADPAS